MYSDITGKEKVPLPFSPRVEVYGGKDEEGKKAASGGGREYVSGMERTAGRTERLRDYCTVGGIVTAGV